MFTKLHRSLVDWWTRQVDGIDCIWRAHTIEPCFGCCAKQLNATRPENRWRTFADDEAALTVSRCLRLFLNQVGWEKSMSNVSYSLPERLAVSKHLNSDLDLDAFLEMFLDAKMNWRKNRGKKSGNTYENWTPSSKSWDLERFISHAKFSLCTGAPIQNDSLEERRKCRIATLAVLQNIFHSQTTNFAELCRRQA